MLKSSFDQNTASRPKHAYLTFWDMDDTLVVTDVPPEKALKNPCLLLPLLLFQTIADNQAMVICTNRHKNERLSAETDPTFYFTKDLIHDLLQYGINLSVSPVIFGAGFKPNPLDYLREFEQALGAFEVESLQQATQRLSIDDASKNDEPQQSSALNLQALSVIEQNVAAIRLAEVYPEVKAALKDLKKGQNIDNALVSLKKIIPTRYHGKNFLINQFMLQHYDIAAQSIQVGTIDTPLRYFHAGIIDDNESVSRPDIMAALGENFFGAKASRAGNKPRDSDEATLFDKNDDYYKDYYLIEAAKHVGLDGLSQECFIDGFSKQIDPMLGIAAFLYGWHAFKERYDITPFQVLLEDLSPRQWLQVSALLSKMQMWYQDHAKPLHPSKHAKDVSPLIEHMLRLNIKEKLQDLLRAEDEYRALCQVVASYHEAHAPSYSLKQIEAEAPPSKAQAKSKKKHGLFKFGYKASPAKSSTASDKLHDFQQERDRLTRLVSEYCEDANPQIKRVAQVLRATFNTTPFSDAPHEEVGDSLTPSFRRTRSKAVSSTQASVPYLKPKKEPKKKHNKK